MARNSCNILLTDSRLFAVALDETRTGAVNSTIMMLFCVLVARDYQRLRQRNSSVCSYSDESFRFILTSVLFFAEEMRTDVVAI